ncbi:hypothetical protein JHK87_017209 [Glycine soja]|nr:hypothetical protein JHK87_017209 [Glycine soja]
MDEPTSGLDARAAAIVMRTVRNTVDTGRTVVCTIHQPSIDIFEAFDESIEGVSKIKDCYNPATWMLEVTTSAQELTLGVDFHEIYKNSELCSSSRQDLFNAIGSMYTAVVFIGPQISGSIQPIVATERTVFYRERAAGMYSALPYAIAQSIPVWWRWFYRICPVAWTIYGLVASQFGDITNVMKSENESVQEFIRSYFGFKHDFIGVCAIMVSGKQVIISDTESWPVKPPIPIIRGEHQAGSGRNRSLVSSGMSDKAGGYARVEGVEVVELPLLIFCSCNGHMTMKDTLVSSIRLSKVGTLRDVSIPTTRTVGDRKLQRSFTSAPTQKAKLASQVNCKL